MATIRYDLDAPWEPPRPETLAPVIPLATPTPTPAPAPVPATTAPVTLGTAAGRRDDLPQGPTTPPPTSPPPPTTPAPSSLPGTATREQVAQLYRDWLGREPDESAWGWTTVPFEQAKAGVVNSAEHKNRWVSQVQQWHRTLLGSELNPGQVEDLWNRYKENIQGVYGEIQNTLASRPPTTPPTTPTDRPAVYDWNWFAGLIGNRAPTPQSLLDMEAALNAQGVTVLRNAAGTAGKIRLPNGQIVDVILGADQGGRGWQWLLDTGSSGGDVPSQTTAGVPLTPTAPVQFNDPYTNQLEQFINNRLTELYRPVDDPLRTQYAALLQGRTDTLLNGSDELRQLLDFINQRATTLQQPVETPEEARLKEMLTGYIAEMQTPGYTGAEQEVIRTSALDPIERDRAAAKQRMLERLGERGLTPDSGIAQEALLQVDATFDGLRAEAQRIIALNELERRLGRSQAALVAGGTAADLSTAQQARQNAQLDQVLSLLTAGVDIPEARQREALDTASALATLSGNVRAEEQNRRQEALSLVGLLADLPVQRLQTALATLGQGEQPGDIMSSLLGIAGLNQRQQQVNTANTAGFWSGLGSLARILASAGAGGARSTAGVDQYLSA